MLSGSGSIAEEGSVVVVDTSTQRPEANVYGGEKQILHTRRAGIGIIK